MAEGLNRVMLLGNLGADPELRMTSGGQAVLKLRLATTESYMDRNKARQERTDWHNIVIWGKRGEALGKFLSKGERIFVEGRIATSSYEDKEGQKRYRTEVIANNVILAGRGRGGGNAYAEDGGAPNNNGYDGGGGRPQERPAFQDSSGGGGGGGPEPDDDFPF